jgi:PAS domain-containing protein
MSSSDPIIPPPLVIAEDTQAQIARALQKSEERFRQVVESAPNVMVMINPQGTIEMVNAQAERVFGFSRGEMLGQPIGMLVPERVRQNLRVSGALSFSARYRARRGPDAASTD